MIRFCQILLLLLLWAQGAIAQLSDWKNKVDIELWAAVEQGTPIDFIVMLQQQADLSAAAQLSTKSEKGQFVYRTLQTLAQQTQKPILEMLQRAEAPFRSFLVVNAIYARGDAQLIQALAARPEVAVIMPNPQVMLEMPVDLQSVQELQARENIEWGIRRIKADQVWALGYTGQGAIVGGQDTGYEWTHPTIQQQYRGWNGTTANHHYNWHDAIRAISPLHRDPVPDSALNPCGLDSKVPCDDHSHGTHTMGTMVGDDGMGNQIGVAPGARWIAARNMERGYGTPATYTECFEWFLAPTDLNGQNPRPELAPHVINNSWSCPELEGCNASNWALMERAINNLRAAGVVVVQSAGNSGAFCHTVNAAAAIFEGAFSVGASRQNDTIANFSSRGTVIADGSGRLKPNVVAPGVGVRSAVRGGGYSTWNGTSMAGPHVAGVVALLISANSALAGQVALIESIIEETAQPMLNNQNCGGLSGMEVPNPVYGYGRIDALAAVQRALQLTSTDSAFKQYEVEIFPNPVRENPITLRLTGFRGDVDFRLFSANGQLLQNQRWSAQAILLETISVQDLPSGIYFYHITGAGATVSGKIVKQ